MIHSYSALSIVEGLKIIVELSKIRISQSVALSTLVGYILATSEISLHALVAVFGTFLLSCGSAALNQYQERDVDGLMKRTRLRPIPSGRVSATLVLRISFSLMAAGSLILLAGVNEMAFTLGLFNVYWYNGIYTPLKRETALAIFPGSIIGAIPPAIGWVAGGQSLFDWRIMIVCSLFFIWQIPHFWLLLMNLSRDYREAGFPSLATKFGERNMALLTYSGIIVTVLTGLLIPVIDAAYSVYLLIALFLSGVWLLWGSRKLLAKSIEKQQFIFVFKMINIYMLLVMIFLSADRLLKG
jgi:protoheme IX farnesyltransferase